jgi:hypothetical protein
VSKNVPSVTTQLLTPLATFVGLNACHAHLRSVCLVHLVSICSKENVSLPVQNTISPKIANVSSVTRNARLALMLNQNALLVTQDSFTTHLLSLVSTIAHYSISTMIS